MVLIELGLTYSCSQKPQGICDTTLPAAARGRAAIRMSQMCRVGLPSRSLWRIGAIDWTFARWHDGLRGELNGESMSNMGLRTSSNVSKLQSDRNSRQ